MAGIKLGIEILRSKFCFCAIVSAWLPVVAWTLFSASASAVESAIPTAAQAAIKQYCVDCHNSTTAEGQINLEQLAVGTSFGPSFKSWRKVAAVLEALSNEIKKALGSKGPGVFAVPGLVKIEKKKVPAKPARKGVPNPFKPGELMDVAAKPASTKIKVRALKQLKAMA